MTVSTSCDLCGLFAGRRPLMHTAPDGRTYRFCCRGCRQVFIMLMEMAEGPDPSAFRETEVFRHCLEIGIIPRTEAEAAEFREKNETAEPRMIPEGGHFLPLDLQISDMWCPVCAWYIEAALSGIPGIAAVACNFSTDRLTLTYDPVQTAPATIIRSIQRLGYRAFVPGDGTLEKENRKAFIRLVVSALFTMNVMMLSFSLYSGFFIDLPGGAAAMISWPVFVMASLVVFYGGWPVIRKTWAGIKSFAFSMETLVFAGAFSAYFYSVYHLLTGSIHLYFDTASMLITLVLLGKMLERKARNRITETQERFLSVIPGKARIFSRLYPNGKYVPVEALRRDDVFGVEAGEVLAADGTVLVGRGRVDESLMTGEAEKVQKGPGDRLLSGTRVVDGVFRVRTHAVGGQSVLGQMAQIMRAAADRKTTLEGPTEKALQWFVPLVVLLAAGTGLYCGFAGFSAKDAIMRAITVMVISCPCALGIAIPLARVAGVAACAKNGILVRNFSSFEQVSKIDTIVLDKTGTVTRGDWKLLDVVSLGGMTRDRALSLAAVLEEGSDHAVAGAIKEIAGPPRQHDITIEDIVHHPRGVSARIGETEIRFGSAGFMEGNLSGNGFSVMGGSFFDEEPTSRVFLSLDQEICAGFIFGDAVKKNARETIAKFKGMGLEVYLISGDEDGVTRKVAEKLGIRVSLGGKTPVEKARFISDLQNRGRLVAMVGDGINDAPAMAGADLAVGIHGNNPLLKETADITLMRKDPGQLLDFYFLAEKVRKKIRQNFWFSVCYNAVGIPVAMAGMLTPIIAVCAMLAGSLTVIGNTLALVRKTTRV